VTDEPVEAVEDASAAANEALGAAVVTSGVFHLFSNVFE
jgi:hypothetical protein